MVRRGELDPGFHGVGNRAGEAGSPVSPNGLWEIEVAIRPWSTSTPKSGSGVSAVIFGTKATCSSARRVPPLFRIAETSSSPEG
jgi:hypothetical protein